MSPSRGESASGEQVVDRGLVVAAGGTDSWWAVADGSGEFDETVAEEPVVGAGEEERLAVPDGGDSVAVAVRDAFDESVMAKTSQVVGCLPSGQSVEITPEEGRQVVTKVAVGEPRGATVGTRTGTRAGPGPGRR